ncbi:germacrene-A synthase-like [Humulus lupulus]|uniref:germacrene-A synthase-like n=1 Tax=Humulus lupulus TaxID=3486 RepID=UPI002B403D9A|nr:germacrene-A synthase-like [Humulus lupulus]
MSQRYKQQEVEELKAVVKKEIFGESAYDVSHQLKLINVVERLGLSYHFESEIENELERIYNKSIDQNYILKDENLHDASLRFRLLRQHGFRVSSADIFEKFKDEDGNFKECLVSDTIGLLSLYEASHLSCVGENILDKALALTTTHLTEFLANKNEHDDPLSKEISQALERPLRKSLETLATRHFISIYENETSHNKVLLQLAKLDFNLLQSMNKKELSEISRYINTHKHTHKSIHDQIRLAKAELEKVELDTPNDFKRELQARKNINEKWNIQMLKEWFQPQDVQRIIKIKLPSYNVDDCWIWNNDSQGTFTIRSAINNRSMNEEEQNSDIWKIIWKVKIHSRHKILWWQICNDALSTKDKLFQITISEDPNCVICNTERGSTFHLFWQCQIVSRLWFGTMGGIKTDEFHFQNWEEWFH